MPLTPGFRLGSFEIVSLLGAGGMGEVYRARDTRLGRDVAIKILPPLFAADAERRARFAREAQLLASLNHPHIAQVFGVEESAGTIGLVMELVDGEPLDAVIAGGALPIPEALPIARQIAEALEAAHERGIVHRDLKPANIKVASSGRVKVLDFGLAKAMDASGPMAELANSPTFVSAATQLGTILGTAAYMSPEQARGKAVDKRADIWAFGCVLFEMLTGRRPFDGETITDILGAIVHKQPDFSRLPADTPPAVAQLLARCLEKDVTRRLRDIGEARVALETTGQVSLVGGASAAPAPAAATPPRAARALWVAAAAIAGALAGAAVMWRLAPQSVAAPQLRLNIALPPGFHMVRPPTISRDGRMIAYTAEPLDGSAPPMVYLRPLNGFEARPVDRSAGATEPFFSPDGKYVGFFADGMLSRAPVGGGGPQSIVHTEFMTGAAWLGDGTIVFSKGLGSGLFRVRADGGTPEAVTALDKARRDYAHVYPQWLGGDRVLFTVWTGSEKSFTCQLSLDAKLTDCLQVPDVTLRYTASGHFLSEGHQTDVGVVAAAPTFASLKLDFEPLLHDVFRFVNQSRSYVSVSDTGTLVYVAGDPADQALAWVAPDGTTTPVLNERHIYGRIALSPDGTRAAYGGSGDLFVVDLQRGTNTRVANIGNNTSPSWGADGRHLFFASNRDEHWAIYVTSEEDQWAPKLVLKRDVSAELPSAGPDGSIAFAEAGPNGRRNIMLAAPDGAVTAVTADAAVAAYPAISPAGGYVAYSSNAAGARVEVFVKSRQGGAAVQVSTRGGAFPSWSPNGDTIYYMQGTTVMAAPFANGRAGTPRVAIAGAPLIRTGVAPSPDGKRFLAAVLQPDAIARDVRVVTSFFDDIRRAAGR